MINVTGSSFRSTERGHLYRTQTDYSSQLMCMASAAKGQQQDTCVRDAFPVHKLVLRAVSKFKMIFCKGFDTLAVVLFLSFFLVCGFLDLLLSSCCPLLVLLLSPCCPSAGVQMTAWQHEDMTPLSAIKGPNAQCKKTIAHRVDKRHKREDRSTAAWQRRSLSGCQRANMTTCEPVLQSGKALERQLHAGSNRRRCPLLVLLLSPRNTSWPQCQAAPTSPVRMSSWSSIALLPSCCPSSGLHWLWLPAYISGRTPPIIVLSFSRPLFLFSSCSPLGMLLMLSCCPFGVVRSQSVTACPSFVSLVCSCCFPFPDPFVLCPPPQLCLLMSSFGLSVVLLLLCCLSESNQ